MYLISTQINLQVIIKKLQTKGKNLKTFFAMSDI